MQTIPTYFQALRSPVDSLRNVLVSEPCVQTLWLYPSCRRRWWAFSQLFLFPRLPDFRPCLCPPVCQQMLTEYFMPVESGPGAVRVPLNANLTVKQLGHRKKTGPRWYSQVPVLQSVHHSGHFASTKYIFSMRVFEDLGFWAIYQMLLLGWNTEPIAPVL